MMQSEPRFGAPRETSETHVRLVLQLPLVLQYGGVFVMFSEAPLVIRCDRAMLRIISRHATSYSSRCICAPQKRFFELFDWVICASSEHPVYSHWQRSGLFHKPGAIRPLIPKGLRAIQ